MKAHKKLKKGDEFESNKSRGHKKKSGINTPSIACRAKKTRSRDDPRRLMKARAIAIALPTDTPALFIQDRVMLGVIVLTMLARADPVNYR